MARYSRIPTRGQGSRKPKIFVLDTRYYKKGPSAFIGEHPEITDVLLLYNMNTLDADTGIGGIY